MVEIFTPLNDQPQVEALDVKEEEILALARRSDLQNRDC